MLYPRTAKVNGEEVLVDENQMRGYREHMTLEHRLLPLSGVIGAHCRECGQGESESHNLLMALDTLSHDPIKIVITSPGGDLDSTFLLYDTIKMIQSPVITIGRYCASAAALLLAAGSKRYLFPHAKVMLHPHTLSLGGIPLSDTDIDIVRQESRKYKEKMIDILLECGAKKSRSGILGDIENKDLWLEPREAVDYGLADEIMTRDIWKGLCK